ncbi:hypothetical protein [Eudoraea sp.]|uniref:hypothetical protein n=1 Tax=Eudoraea sp. TaxID=1979955 RepID=UPI003C7505BB
MGGNKGAPIKACFFQGLKNEKSPAEGRGVWHFQLWEQRNSDPDNYRGMLVLE